MATRNECLNTGLIFKATRKFHRLNQTELASAIDITQGTVSKIESREMDAELTLWFRFLKRFNITDPYCFLEGVVEFKECEFESLKKNGSALAPAFDFLGGNYLCTINSLRPIYFHLTKYKNSDFTKYLKSRSIREEIFIITNHPLPKDFIDSFFTFLKEMKLNDEALVFLIPGFSRSSIYGIA